MPYILVLVAGITFGAIAVCLISRAQSTRPTTPVSAEPVAIPPKQNDDLITALTELPLGVFVKRSDGELWQNQGSIDIAGSKHAEVLIEEVVTRLLASVREGVTDDETLKLIGPPARYLFVQARGLSNGVSVATVEDVSEQERLDSVRTDFVANISHELKTPIGALSILSETLSEESDPEIVSRLAGKVVTEATRLSNTVDDLLELSRIELGGGAVKDPVYLDEIAKSAVERMLSPADHQGVSVKVVKSDSGVVVAGDPRQLLSATANLIDNAIKYSDQGQTVELTVEADNGSGVICVIDHGVGIPAADLSRIFERFYRVDRARSRNTGGTGLGLAIVNHVVTNHGGSVTVNSVEGEGSTFCLRLPLIGK